MYRVTGATEGLGATEVARRDLDEHDPRAVLIAERDERLDLGGRLRARCYRDA